MADSRDFQIRIVTTADTAGIHEVRGELAALKEDAAVPFGGGSAGTIGLTGRAARRESEVAAADAVLTKEQKQAAIESQIATIEGTRLELIEAQAAGDTERVAILQRELGIRSSILTVMKSSTLTQGELVAATTAEEASLAAVGASSAAAAEGGLLAGVNIARARNEAVTFVRELSTGAPTTRTLGALLGSLGPKLIGGALAGLVLKNEIDKIAEAQQKVNVELDTEGAKVVALGEKWRLAAKQAITPEDVTRVAEEGLSEIDSIGARIKQIATEDVPAMERTTDIAVAAFKNAFTFKGDPNAKGPYQTIKDNEMAALVLLQQQLVEQKRRAIEAADATEKSFDKLKGEPVADSLKKVIAQIDDLKNKQQQQEITTEGGQKKWLEYAQGIQTAEKELKILIDLDKERKTIDDAGAEGTVRLNTDLQRVVETLRDLGVAAQTPGEAFAAASQQAGALGDVIRRLAVQWSQLQQQQVSTLSADLFKTPTARATEGENRLRQQKADDAMRRELGIVDDKKAVGAENKAALEEERRQLIEKNALQRTLVPPGAGMEGSEALQALGKQGLEEFNRNEERIRQINRALTTDALGRPINQATGAVPGAEGAPQPPAQPIPAIPGYDFNPNTGEYVPKSQRGSATATPGATTDDPHIAEAVRENTQAVRDQTGVMRSLLQEWS